jgi:predicted hotdog family 3-hydroxylacyl-ACP dehydratase
VIADRRRIEELLPHGSGMVLLDRVLSRDGETILCAADSHRDPDNPLRRHGGLPAMAAIEYAAQAAAVHGALSGQRVAGAGAVLGGVKDVKALAQWGRILLRGWSAIRRGCGGGTVYRHVQVI